MTKRIPLHPTPENYNHWIRHFVPNIMLWWWDDSPIPSPENALRVLDRSQGRTDSDVRDIISVNAFHTWAMTANVSWIVVDDGRWISSLNSHDRKIASDIQVRLKRGLCIPLERFGDYAGPEFTISGDRVALDQHIWASLPDEARRAVIESEIPEWDRDTTYAIPDDAPQHIAEVANTFVMQEGVNCLSVTAFAISADTESLLHWMFPEGFVDILQANGYTEYFGKDVRRGDVLVFRNEDGSIVHAAYALEPDRLLNKNGQSSFNPVAINDFATLCSDWGKFEYVIHRPM